MLKLFIGNSYSRLEGLSMSQFKELRELLSYDPGAKAAYFAGGHRSTKKYLIDKKCQFPSGLLPRVVKWIERGDMPIQKIDDRPLPKPRKGLFTMCLPYPPYPEQVSAAEACRKSERGIVVAPTGLGKSVIAALIVNAIQVPTLIVVPSIELKRQLRESLRNIFGNERVGALGWPIAVENVDALDPNKELKGYDCVIIDEYHHSAAATYQKLNKKAWGGVFARFGLTATPQRNQDHEQILLESIISEVIYKVDYQVAVSNGRIVPMEAYYYDLPQQEIKGNDSSWASVYSECVVNNELQNRLIASVIATITTVKIPTLCLVKEVRHGEIISNLTGKSFVHGQSIDPAGLIAAFNNGHVNTLIGTTGIIGEGCDTKPCEYVIIAAGGKSKPAFMQQVGRAFRIYPGKESCKVILFNNPSHKWLKAHFKAQVKILREEYGVIPVRLELPKL